MEQKEELLSELKNADCNVLHSRRIQIDNMLKEYFVWLISNAMR